MHKLLLVILLSAFVILAIFGCSDKSTEPNSDDNIIKQAKLTVHVNDEFHYPIYEAKVTIIMYMKDSSQGITSVHRTNIAGIVEMTPCVIESILDTFTVIAYKDSLIPDTGGFRILHDNQNIDLWFTLLQDTTL